MSYPNRLHALHKRRDWSLVSGAIAWAEESGASGRIEYSQIRQVRLRFEPTRSEKARVLLQVCTARERESISNFDYRGPLESADQSEAFAAFVEELHQALAATPNKIDYLGGWTLRGYRLMLLLCGLILLADIGFGVFLYLEEMPTSSFLAVLAVLGLLASLIVLTRRNRPFRYDRREIPWNRFGLDPVASP
jgi:hypothetical protein